MAGAPCDVHGEPRPGRLVGAYPSLLRDNVRTSKYRRLCTDCARDLVSSHARDWIDEAAAGPLREIQACTACGELQDSNAALTRFRCTVYLDGKNRRDYAAAYCPGCTKLIAREFALDD